MDMDNMKWNMTRDYNVKEVNDTGIAILKWLKDKLKAIWRWINVTWNTGKRGPKSWTPS